MSSFREEMEMTEHRRRIVARPPPSVGIDVEETDRMAVVDHDLSLMEVSVNRDSQICRPRTDISHESSDPLRLARDESAQELTDPWQCLHRRR